MSTRIARSYALVGALLVLAQLGGGLRGRDAVGEIERSASRPVPQAPTGPQAPTVPMDRAPEAWVPDRNLLDPVHGGTSFVPGHWERRLPNGDYYAPPSTACNLGSGECSMAPAGVRPPPDTRPPLNTPMAP